MSIKSTTYPLPEALSCVRNSQPFSHHYHTPDNSSNQSRISKWCSAQFSFWLLRPSGLQRPLHDPFPIPMMCTSRRSLMVDLDVLLVLSPVSIHSIHAISEIFLVNTSIIDATDDSKQVLTLLYDKYIAAIGPGIPITESRKNCAVNLDVHYPSGWQYTLFTTDYRGFIDLDKGVTGTQSATYYFSGQQSQVKHPSRSSGSNLVLTRHSLLYRPSSRGQRARTISSRTSSLLSLWSGHPAALACHSTSTLRFVLLPPPPTRALLVSSPPTPLTSSSLRCCTSSGASAKRSWEQKGPDDGIRWTHRVTMSWLCDSGSLWCNGCWFPQSEAG